MKKLLAVLMMSVSFFVAQAGHTQSRYAEGSYHSSGNFGTQTDVGAENAAVWVFGLLTFLSFLLALFAAWDDLEAWLEEWGDSDDPDLDDKRILNVCDFYYEYRDDHDLKAMGEILEENKYCK